MIIGRILPIVVRLEYRVKRKATNAGNQPMTVVTCTTLVVFCKRFAFERRELYGVGGVPQVPIRCPIAVKGLT